MSPPIAISYGRRLSSIRRRCAPAVDNSTPPNRSPGSEGYDLLRGEPCWVPAEIVHTDYTLPQRDGYFLAGSNGLASGNHLIEAINAALYELVERDAFALWTAQSWRRRASYAPSTSPLSATRIAARSSPDMRRPRSPSGFGMSRPILASLRFSAKSAIFRPAIRSGCDRFHGSGCHADRAIALVRALTEAAQTRLTYIAGIRDDLSPAGYSATPDDEIRDALLDALDARAYQSRLPRVPNFAADDLAADLRWALGRLCRGRDRSRHRCRPDPAGFR